MRATVYTEPGDGFKDDPLAIICAEIACVTEVVVKEHPRMIGRDRLLIVLDGGGLDIGSATP